MKANFIQIMEKIAGMNVMDNKASDSFPNFEFHIYKQFLANICYDFFLNWQTEKKTCFGPIRNLFSFSTAQTQTIGVNKLVKKI